MSAAKDTGKRYGTVTGTITSDNPWSKISTDILGPLNLLVLGEMTKVHLLVINCRFSQWTHLEALPRITGEALPETIERIWLDRHPKPYSILSDKGRQFTSIGYLNMLTKRGIKGRYSTPYNPTGNSISERVDRTIMNMLRTLKHLEVKEIIEKVEFALNRAHHRSIIGVYLIHRSVQFQSVRTQSESNQKAQERNNKMRVRNYRFHTGMKVYRQKNIRCDKLGANLEGPVEILATKSNANTCLLNLGYSNKWTNVKVKTCLSGRQGKI